MSTPPIGSPPFGNSPFGVIEFGCFTPQALAQIAAKFRVVRTPYTYTADDVTNGYARVPVVFPTPFADANYTVVWGLENLQSSEPGIYFTGDQHAPTKAGLEVGIYAYAAGDGTQGDKFIVHVIAIHD